MLKSCVTVETFKIILTKPTATYIPGEIISGAVIVVLNTAIKCRGIKLTFDGRAVTNWSEDKSGVSVDDGGTSEKHTASQEYFWREIYVIGNSDEEIELVSGQRLFRFNFRLPEKIPSNFTHVYGEVDYSIEAAIDRIWRPNNTTIIHFKVDSPNDLSEYQSVSIEDSINRNYYGCCLFPYIGRGCLDARIRIPKNAYAIGETIHVGIELDYSSESIPLSKIKLGLQQIFEFSCHSCEKAKQVSRIVLPTLCNGPFSPGIPIEVGFPVPILPHSHMRHCSIINVQYRLHIELILSGCHSSIGRSYAIEIGSKLEATPTLLSKNQTLQPQVQEHPKGSP